MPLYEYRCARCGRKATLYVRGFDAGNKPASACPACGATELKRLFSTFARLKTDKDVYEDILGDKSLVKRMLHNDPAALVEWNKKMSRGDDAVAPEYEDMMDRMEAGEWPSRATGDEKGESPGAEEAE